MKDIPQLIVLDPIPDTNNNATLRWDDGSENGDTEKQPIATVYDWDDAQGIVEAWNACQLTGVNYHEHASFRKKVDNFLQVIEAHKAQYNGSSAQKIFAEELCKLEGELKSHLRKFKKK